MWFAKKILFGLFLTSCLSFNVALASDTDDDFPTNPFFEDIYFGRRQGTSILDYWNAIKYFVDNPYPLSAIDFSRLKQLVAIVKLNLSNIDKYWLIEALKTLAPKPSQFTLNMLNTISKNFYLLHMQTMPELDLGPVDPRAESLL